MQKIEIEDLQTEGEKKKRIEIMKTYIIPYITSLVENDKLEVSQYTTLLNFFLQNEMQKKVGTWSLDEIMKRFTMGWLIYDNLLKDDNLLRDDGIHNSIEDKVVDQAEDKI